MTSMNRRANLAGTASAAVASPAIAFPIAPHPDAELLALGERLRSAQIALRAASNRAEAGGAAYTARRAPMPDACRPKPGDNEGLEWTKRNGPTASMPHTKWIGSAICRPIAQVSKW